MRAMWKGSVAFGLVSVPVSLYTATGSHDMKFHQVRASDGSRVRYRRVAEADGEEVEYSQIAKSIEVGGEQVVLTDDDMEQLPLSSSKEIEIGEFVPAESIDPMWLDKSYYLEPDPKAIKPYVLLREALTRTERVAVVTVALRQRESMAVLRVRDKAIVLQTMLWPDEVREPAFDVLDTEVELKAKEVQMADSLVESLAADFDPSQYEDHYAEAVQQLVTAKIEGGEVIRREVDEKDDGEVIDLMAALRKSIDGSKKPASGEKPAAKKTAAKKAPAKKAPAKKAAAKKAPAKKAKSA
ncbi:MAG: Ku protein [Nocardioidaceae bacterium]|nr:Ku protein [Nocardioidaceae bacterium]